MPQAAPFITAGASILGGLKKPKQSSSSTIDSTRTGTSNSTLNRTGTRNLRQDPFIRSASMDALGKAKAISERAYTPFAGQRVAGLSENEQQASRLAGSMGESIQPFRDRLAGGFSQGVLDQFRNPYLDQVLGNQRRVLGEEYGRQSARLAANQSATDAFRSGRSDLARSRLDTQRMTALGDAEAEGQAGGFDRALAAYFNQGNLDINAMQGVTGANTAQIGALSSTGLAERGVTQAGLDFDYGQFLEGRDWDVNNLGPLLAAIQAARGDTTQVDTENVTQTGSETSTEKGTSTGTATGSGGSKIGAYGGLLASLLGGGLFGSGGSGSDSGGNSSPIGAA